MPSSPKIVGYATRMGARDPEEVMSATLETVATRIADFEGNEFRWVVHLLDRSRPNRRRSQKGHEGASSSRTPSPFSKTRTE